MRPDFTVDLRLLNNYFRIVSKSMYIHMSARLIYGITKVVRGLCRETNVSQNEVAEAKTRYAKICFYDIPFKTR